MEWYAYIAHFFAGVLLANGVPHFVNGISGRRFQTPFASPPAIGESSPLVNVLWGFGNLAVGYLLLTGVRPVVPGLSLDSLALGLGWLLISVALSVLFVRLHGQVPRHNKGRPHYMIIL